MLQEPQGVPSEKKHVIKLMSFIIKLALIIHHTIDRRKEKPTFEDMSQYLQVNLSVYIKSYEHIFYYSNHLLFFHP